MSFANMNSAEMPETTCGMEASVVSGTAPSAPKALRQELQDRMQEFLERDMFSLVIQPVVDYRDEQVTNGEALSRLYHPERGVIFPDEFLPVIDALGLYPRFDRYVFQKCCAWLHRSRDEVDGLDCLSCNFSRRSLSEAGIAQDLIHIADSYAIPHRKLAVEITEREQKTDEQQLIENLKLLRSAGFRIILDDYGNGITSVNDLMQYPLDIVKIDRSLLLKAATEQGKTAFRAMVSMFIELGAEVVCEGIETEEQDRFARQAGCHYGQGFLHFKPIPQDRVFEMMHKGSLLEDDV